MASSTLLTSILGKPGNSCRERRKKLSLPEYLCDYRPDVVVVMNPVFAAEIQSMLGIR